MQCFRLMRHMTAPVALISMVRNTIPINSLWFRHILRATMTY